MATQRRKLTYGRNATKQHFSTSFQTLSIKTPQKKASHSLGEPNVSPSPSAKRAHNAPAVFDVPESDSDSSSLPSPERPVAEPQTKKLKSAQPQDARRTDARGPVQHAATEKVDQSKRAAPAPSSRRASRAPSPQTVAGSKRSKELAAGPKPVLAKSAPSTSKSTSAARGPTPRNGFSATTAAPKSSAEAHNKISLPIQTKALKRNLGAIQEDPVDVFDFPEDQTKLRTTPTKSPRERPSKAPRMERPKTPSPVSTPSRPTAAFSPRSTPAKTPKTPRVATTPRQARLWDTLLADDEVMGDDAVYTSDAETRSAKKPRLLPRARLIDALRTAPSSPMQVSDDGDATTMEPRETLKDDEAPLSLSQTEYQPPASQTSQPLGPKITYAQQRSYLQNDAQSIEELLSQPLDLGIGPALSKHQASQKQTSSLEEEENTTTGGMKNIHELRAAGDERRFDDDMNGIIDDISTNGKAGRSAKRAALLDLAKKLSEPSLKSRFNARSLAGDVMKRCGPEIDPICGAALCACVTLILADPVEPRSAGSILDSDIRVVLSAMFELSNDLRSIAKDRKTNMARAAQGAVADLAKNLDASLFWNERELKTISPCLLALKAVEILERRLKEARHPEPLLDRPLTSKVVELLRQGTDALAEADDPAPAMLIELSVSALESRSIPRQGVLQDDIWDETSLEVIANALSGLLQQSEDGDLGQARMLCLRLFLNLANNNGTNSDAFAQESLVGKLMMTAIEGFAQLPELTDDPDRKSEFDELVLALGVMFNLAEMSSRARDLMALEHADKLQRMVVLFRVARGKAHDAESMEGTQANVAYGYLAILLGNICLSPAGLRAITLKLPEKKPSSLVEAIEEFVRFNNMVDQQDDNEANRTFTGRLQAVADNLKKAS